MNSADIDRQIENLQIAFMQLSNDFMILRKENLELRDLCFQFCDTIEALNKHAHMMQRSILTLKREMEEAQKN